MCEKGGVRTPATPPLDPPLLSWHPFLHKSCFNLKSHSAFAYSRRVFLYLQTSAYFLLHKHLDNPCANLQFATSPLYFTLTKDLKSTFDATSTLKIMLLKQRSVHKLQIVKHDHFDLHIKTIIQLQKNT